MHRHGLVQVVVRAAGTGLPIHRALPRTPPGRVRERVPAGPGTVPGRGHGEAGQGRPGRDEGAGERFCLLSKLYFPVF